MSGLAAVPSWDTVYPLAMRAARAVFLFAAAVLLARLAGAALRRKRGRLIAFMLRRGDRPSVEVEKRAATISDIFRNAVVVTIYAGALMMALREAGFDIGPLLAGAGIAGIAVGFGAQNLVRDIISGIFLLLENQIRVDDVVTINGTTGAVEEINLRTTVLRGNDGTVHVFRNGGINTLSNLTLGYSYYVFNLRVGYKEDTDRVAAVLKDIGEELRAEHPYDAAILAPLEILGIDQLTDAGPVIQARFKTVPMRQWEVGREMNRRIKKRFGEMGIELK